MNVLFYENKISLQVFQKQLFYIFSLYFRVQEIIGDGQKESGRIPRTVDCELTYDLGL